MGQGSGREGTKNPSEKGRGLHSEPSYSRDNRVHVVGADGLENRPLPVNGTESHS